MKNFISVFICFTFLCLITYSCGPNAEQIAKQKVQDSIYRVDSLITIQKQLAEKHIQDSIKLTTYNKGDTIIVKFKEAIMIMDATNAIDLNSVEEQSMSYNGKIRGTLRNGIGIEAECSLENLRNLRGYSKISSSKQKQKGLTIETTLKAKEQENNPQELILVNIGQKKWCVKSIVK